MTNDVSDFDLWCKTPAWVFDIAKFCSGADFPVYALKANISGFRLSNSPRYSWDGELDPPRAYGLHCLYVSPGYTDFNQSMMTSCYGRDQSLPFPYELMGTLGTIMRHTPNTIKHGFDRSRLGIWKDTSQLFDLDLSAHLWNPCNGSGLQFEVFRQDEPAAFSMAYHLGEKSHLFVTAFGTSSADFLTILDSLICLQENTASIERLQRELEEGAQQYRQMVEQDQNRAPRRQHPSD